MSEQELVKKKQYSIEDFKAFNYVFHGKRDTDIKVFDENRKITRADIVDLHNKICSKLEKENIITNLFSLNLNLNNGILKEFSNWEVFNKEDLGIKEETQNITIEYDFSVQLPLYSIPQRHTLKLRIGGALRFDEYLKLAMNGSEDHELIEKTSDVVCKVDFINYLLANELKNLIEEWYKALPRNKPSNPIVRFALKHRVKIEELFKVLFLLIGSLLMYFASKKFLFNDFHFEPDTAVIIDSFYKTLLSSAIVIYVFYSMGRLYSERISKKIISRLEVFPILQITKGDKNKAEQIKKNNWRNTIKLIIQITIGLVANGLTYLIGQLLTN